MSKIFSFFLLTSFFINANASEIIFSNNPYRVEISDGATTINSNEPLKVQYDATRLYVCSASNRMQQSFLTLSYSFDNRPAKTEFLYAPSTTTAVISIPQGAHTVAIWFHNYTLNSPNSSPTCEAYDSNFGQNFNFSIQ